MKKRNLVAAAANNAGDSALGNLIWYSVGDLELKREEIENLANNAGLPDRFLPPAIRVVDAFRRATSEVGGVILNGTDKVTETLLVREVSSDKNGVIRHLVKETADKKHKQLNYDHCGTFKYDRQNEYMLGTSYVDEVAPAVEKAKTLFHKYRNYYIAEHMRRMVKTVLYDCQSITLRPSGAVYFVPKQHEDKVQALRNFMKCLPGNTEIHLMPVVDLAEQREMLEQKLRSHVNTELSRIGSMLGGNAEVLTVKQGLKKLASQFAETLRSAEVSKAAANNAVEQLQALNGQVRKYEGLLETNLSEVRSTLDILRNQVRLMLDKVVVEKHWGDVAATA